MTKAAAPSAEKATWLGRKPTVKPRDSSLSPRVITETSWKLPGGAPPVRAGLSYQATTCLASGATARAFTPGTTGTVEVRVTPASVRRMVRSREPALITRATSLPGRVCR
jgi:hypothetical protein